MTRVGQVARTLDADGSPVRLGRTAIGTAHITAVDEAGLAWGTGYVHARDRGRQLLTLRLVGQGRLAECLRDDEASLASDIWFRRAGFAAEAVPGAGHLDGPTRHLVDAYCRGVRAGFAAVGTPVEFRALGYQPAPWAVADTVGTMALLGWIGLAQTQAELETALVAAVHRGVDPVRLRALFAPHLAGLDAHVVGLLRRLALLPEPQPGAPAVLPDVLASNAWAVAGSRTVSGSPVLAADPHLDVARLPALWCELVTELVPRPTPARTDPPSRENAGGPGRRVGISVPGLPGLVMGRTGRVAFAFSYGYLDMVDFFVEDVRDGAVLRGADRVPVSSTRETVRRRRGSDVTVWAHRTDCGLLQVPAGLAASPDGLLLARSYSGGGAGPARSLGALTRLAGAGSVGQLQDISREAALSATWVFADTTGATGLQQSGAAPRRTGSGLVPAPAWERDRHWDGLLAVDRLVHRADPDSGLLVAANQACNPVGGPVVVNAGGPGYRAERIHEVLGAATPVDVADCMRLQADVRSEQGVRLLPVFAPLAPETPAGRELAGWDARYDTGSRGAVVFEVTYRAVLRAVFGTRLFGAAEWDRLVLQTAMLTAYAAPFDDVLAGGDPLWWAPGGRAAVLGPVIAAALARFDGRPVPQWGEVNRLQQRNLLRASPALRRPDPLHRSDLFVRGWLGRVPGAGGRPVPVAGGRATVAQAQATRGPGRAGLTGQSWRLVTDLAAPTAWTALPGGACDRPWSSRYRNRFAGWLAHRYDRVDLGD